MEYANFYLAGAMVGILILAERAISRLFTPREATLRRLP